MWDRLVRPNLRAVQEAENFHRALANAVDHDEWQSGDN
jgi:hypothetical protein